MVKNLGRIGNNLQYGHHVLQKDENRARFHEAFTWKITHRGFVC